MIPHHLTQFMCHFTHALEPATRLLPSRPRCRAPRVRPNAPSGPAGRHLLEAPPRRAHLCHPHAFRRHLRAMHARGLTASTFALGSAVPSAAAVSCPALGAQLRSLAFKAGLADNVFRATALPTMYCKCGRMRDACQVFDGMPSWNETC